MTRLETFEVIEEMVRCGASIYQVCRVLKLTRMEVADLIRSHRPDMTSRAKHIDAVDSMLLVIEQSENDFAARAIRAVDGMQRYRSAL